MVIFSLITDFKNDFFVFGEFFKIKHLIKFQKNIIKLALMIDVKVKLHSLVILEDLIKLPLQQMYNRSSFADSLKIDN